MKRAAFTVAVNQRHDSVLFRFFLGIGTVLGLAADESFVDLDNVLCPPIGGGLFGVMLSRIRWQRNQALLYVIPSMRDS